MPSHDPSAETAPAMADLAVAGVTQEKAGQLARAAAFFHERLVQINPDAGYDLHGVILADGSVTSVFSEFSLEDRMRYLPPFGALIGETLIRAVNARWAENDAVPASLRGHLWVQTQRRDGSIGHDDVFAWANALLTSCAAADACSLRLRAAIGESVPRAAAAA